MRNPIIAALDVPTAEAALKLVEQLAPVSGGFKIGSELFTSAGPDIVRRIRERGALVFLDLKFHDIPNTVAKSVAAAMQLDVQMLTVHTSGGLEMLKAAEQAAQETAWRLGHSPPLVLGVTVLTSLDAGALKEIGLDGNVDYQVRRLATVAIGPACAGWSARRWKSPNSGNAPAQYPTGDPRRPHRRGKGRRPETHINSARSHRRRVSANWLVIGRPIYAAENPRAATEKILESLT